MKTDNPPTALPANCKPSPCDPSISTEVMLEGAILSPRRDDLPKVTAYPY